MKTKKTNHNHPRTPSESSNHGKRRLISVCVACRRDCPNCADKNIQEEMEKDYKRFSTFWENAREHITDEDGDKFLNWDKSNIGHFSFSSGFEQGRKQTIKKVKEMIRKQYKFRGRYVNTEELLEKLK